MSEKNMDKKESRRAVQIVSRRFLKTAGRPGYDADPDVSRFVALGFMRAGYSFGDEDHKEAAAETVAVKFGILRAGGNPDTKKVRLWYEWVLEGEKLRTREQARNRGV